MSKGDKKREKKAQEAAGRKSRKTVLLAVVGLALVAGLAAAAIFLLADDSIKMKVGSAVFTLEVADNDDARAKGLSNRAGMADDAGMLFVYPKAKKMHFWMKDTSIPLTIAYLADDGTILELYDMMPLSERDVSSKAEVRYVLELKLGAFKTAGAKVGDRIASVSGAGKYGVPF